MNHRSNTNLWKRPTVVLWLIAVLALTPTLSGCELIDSDITTKEPPTDNALSEPSYADPAPEGGEYNSIATEEDKGVTLGYDRSTARTVPSPGTPGAGPDAATIPAEDRLVIRRVDMRLRVDSIAKAVDDIRSSVGKYKGTIVDLNISTDEGGPVFRTAETPLDSAPLAGYLTVRLPAASLDAFLDEIIKVGTVLRETENRSDVTQEHIDLNARLKNLRATEAQLRNFLTKAKNVTEMLAVEQELSRVRGEIESMQAQIAYLERQAAHSTVTIELTGPKPIVRPTGEDWGFAQALTESIRAFVRTVNTLIVVFGAFAPIIIVLAVVGLLIRAVILRARRARATTETGKAASETSSEEKSLTP